MIMPHCAPPDDLVDELLRDLVDQNDLVDKLFRDLVEQK